MPRIDRPSSMAGLDLKLWELLCYCFIFVVGLIGNVTVILVVLKSGATSCRFRQVPFNVYLMSLATVDLTLAVICLPVYVMSTAKFPHPTGTKGDIFCKIITGYMPPFWFAGVSIYMLVIISFERYIAVSKPFKAMTRSISKTTFLSIAGAWLIGFVIQIPTIVGEKFTATDPSIGNYCTFQWPNRMTSTSIYACTFTAQYVVPALVFVINFYRIHKCLSRLDGNLRRSLGDARQRVKVLKRKKKTVRVVLVVSAVFFVCWTPNNVMYFLFQYGGQKRLHWNSDGYQAGIILGFFNSCINPFLYAFQSRDFRNHGIKVLKKLFGIKTGGTQQGSSEGSSSSRSFSRSKIKFRSLVEES